MGGRRPVSWEIVGTSRNIWFLLQPNVLRLGLTLRLPWELLWRLVFHLRSLHGRVRMLLRHGLRSG